MVEKLARVKVPRGKDSHVKRVGLLVGNVWEKKLQDPNEIMFCGRGLEYFSFSSAYDPKNKSCKKDVHLKGFSKYSKMGVFLCVIFFLVPEIFKISYYASYVTDDVIGCAGTAVRHKIKSISSNIEAMLLKLGGDAASCKIYQMVHSLLLPWQHARFQSPASPKLNITICDSRRQNTRFYLRRMASFNSIASLLAEIWLILCITAILAQPTDVISD